MAKQAGDAQWRSYGAYHEARRQRNQPDHAAAHRTDFRLDQKHRRPALERAPQRGASQRRIPESRSSLIAAVHGPAVDKQQSTTCGGGGTSHESDALCPKRPARGAEPREKRRELSKRLKKRAKKCSSSYGVFSNLLKAFCARAKSAERLVCSPSSGTISTLSWSSHSIFSVLG